MTRLKHLMFAGLTWIGLFILAEGGLRLYYYGRGKDMPTPDASLTNEWRWARTHLAAGTPRFETDLIFDELLGWRVRPNQNTDICRTNSQGMRNIREFDPTPAPGRQRLLFVGDSFTYGHRIENEAIFSHVLGEEFLPDWDVLNMAISGTGTDQQLLAYEHYGKPFNPHVVVLGFYVRNYARNLLRFRHYAKPRFAVTGAGSGAGGEPGIALTGSPVITPERLYEEYARGQRTFGRWYESYLVNIVRKQVGRAFTFSVNASTPGWRLLAGIMFRFHTAVTASGARPVWLIIPDDDILHQNPSIYEPIELLCVEESARLGMPCLRLEPHFRSSLQEHPDRPLYRPREAGGHLSAEGHHLTAQLLYEYLRERGVLNR